MSRSSTRITDRIGRGGLRLAALAFAGGSLLASSTDMLAQGTPATRTTYTRDQTRDMIDDFSNSLQDRDQERRRTNSNRAFPNPASAPGAAPGVVTAELKQLRTLIRDFSNDASQLTYALNEQIRVVPSLRPLYTDALRVSAEAVGLDKRAGQVNDHRQLSEEFQDLDADWRELAYRLESVRGLQAETRDLIANLNDGGEAIRKQLKMQPQLNRQGLYMKTASLAGDLENLIDDIGAELGRSKNAQQYLMQGGRVRQEVLGLAALARDDQADTALVVEEYKRVEAMWLPLAVKLQAEDNRYLERSLRRITQTSGEIHQLLLLPQKMDKQQLVYLTSALKKDIDEFFEKTPLILVVHLPKAKSALATADQFYGVCEHFVDVVNQGTQVDEIVDSFHYIEQAEKTFNEVFSAIDSDRAVAVLQRIDQTVSTIRTALQLQREDFNRSAANDLAASIENLTEQLDFAAKRWLNDDRQPFAKVCLQETASMGDSAVRLHQDLVRGVPVAQLRREMDELYDSWRTVYGYLVKCQTDDRPTLGRLSSRLTPALVELRTMITQ